MFLSACDFKKWRQPELDPSDLTYYLNTIDGNVHMEDGPQIRINNWQ